MPLFDIDQTSVVQDWTSISSTLLILPYDDASLAGACSFLIETRNAVGNVDAFVEELFGATDDGLGIAKAQQAPRMTGSAVAVIQASVYRGRLRFRIESSATGGDVRIRAFSRADAISRLERNQWNYSLVATSLSTGTPLDVSGCSFFTLSVVTAGAVAPTTNPTYGLQFSDDGALWTDSGLSLTGPHQVRLSGSVATQAKFARVVVKTIGAGPGAVFGSALVIASSAGGGGGGSSSGGLTNAELRATAVPVSVSGTAAVTAIGTVAEDAAAGTSAPVMQGLIARTAEAPATIINGDVVRGTSIGGTGAQAIGLGTVYRNIDVASAARSTSGNSGTLSSPAGGTVAYAAAVTVAGTSLDVTVEESVDGGTTWYVVGAFDRFAATGTKILNTGRILGQRRIAWVPSGSFTFGVTGVYSHSSAPLKRNLIDRTMVPTTTGSLGSVLTVDGTSRLTLLVVAGAGGASPVLYGIQVSNDGTNYADSGLALSVGASLSKVASVDVDAKFARPYVITGVASTTLNHAELRAS